MKRGIWKRKRNELRVGSKVSNENKDMKQRDKRKRKFNVLNYIIWGQKVEEKGELEKERGMN